MSDNVERHASICNMLNEMYRKKNHDYGDSFHLSYLEEGMAMPRIRLSDKLNRFKMLSKQPEARMVNDESIKDTLLDLANYAIMTVMELEGANKQEKVVSTQEKMLRNDQAEETLMHNGRYVVLKCNCGWFCVDDTQCTICDVCWHRAAEITDEPCVNCIHADGGSECFVLDKAFELERD